jgi:hypothetical protein
MLKEEIEKKNYFFKKKQQKKKLELNQVNSLTPRSLT